MKKDPTLWTLMENHRYDKMTEARWQKRHLFWSRVWGSFIISKKTSWFLMNLNSCLICLAFHKMNKQQNINTKTNTQKKNKHKNQIKTQSKKYKNKFN